MDSQSKYPETRTELDAHFIQVSIWNNDASSRANPSDHKGLDVQALC